MIRFDATYDDRFKPADEQYPWGSAIDATTEESNDGTPYKARWRNDVVGAFQAIFFRAFGNTRQPSNNPDNVLQSDIADAIQKLIDKSIGNQWYQFEIKGEETVIDWATFGINFDADKKYLIVAQPAGNYEEFMPIGTEAKNDGVHIYPRRLIDGKIIPGTRRIKWGSFVFGSRKFGESETMNINLLLKELQE